MTTTTSSVEARPRRDRIPGSERLVAFLDEIQEVVDGLRHGVEITLYDPAGQPLKGKRRSPSLVELMSLLAAARRDGYPTSSMGGGGSPSNVLDDEGNPIPPMSDPTGELATADSRIVDPIRFNGESVLRGVTGALGDLRMARDALVKCSEHMETGPGEPGCSSHARIGHWVPIRQDGRCGSRCDWCYRFWTTEGVDAPEELLRAHDAGRRITQPMVNEALAKRSKKRRPKR